MPIFYSVYKLTNPRQHSTIHFNINRLTQPYQWKASCLMETLYYFVSFRTSFFLFFLVNCGRQGDQVRITVPSGRRTWSYWRRQHVVTIRVYLEETSLRVEFSTPFEADLTFVKISGYIGCAFISAMVLFRRP
jgi:hypothetical protein